MCPHATINVSAINVSVYVSHTAVCVLILLCMWCMCPHTTMYVVYVFSYYYVCGVCVLILLYMWCMCPHTTVYVVLGAFDAWLLMRGMYSTYDMCPHTRLYMCPHTSTYVLILVHMWF
jgi:hypothetical protein